MGNASKITQPDGGYLAYTYDDAHRLTKITGNLGDAMYCYDRHGNVTDKFQSVAGYALAMHYTYDLADHLQSVDYGTDGSSVSYGRDDNGRIASVTSMRNGKSTALVSQISYLPFGPTTTVTFVPLPAATGFSTPQVVRPGPIRGGPVSNNKLSKTYGQNYTISDVVGTAATNDVINLHFITDPMGNITAEGPQAELANAAETYGYDALNRLTTVDNTTQPDRAFIYNPTGDRLSDDVAGSPAKTYGYAAATHHLTDVAGTARSVDTAGYTTTIGETRLDYNDAGRLAGVAPPVMGGSAGYTYNGLGQRVVKNASALLVGGGQPTGLSIYTYLENGRLAAEYREVTQCLGFRGHPCTGFTKSLELVHQYVWANTTLVAVSDGTPSASAWRDVYTDQLGTPRAITNPADAIVWRWPWTNNAFGAAPAQTDPDDDGVHFDFNLRYPGQYYDAESGLHYNTFRDYEPGTGRYAESDPIGLAGGISTYGYVGGDPMSFTDQLGLIKLPNDPSGLPPNWHPDTSHRDPNGERWTNGTDELDFHKGRPGKPGWRGKDHWHHDGGDKHYSPGDQCPTTDDPPPSDDEKFMERMSKITGLTGTALAVYLIFSEGSRVFPPRNLVPVP